MKTILHQPDEPEVPPLDPKKVFLFGVLLAMIVLAGWRYWRAQKAVAEVAEASKDYRKLFPARSSDAPPAPPPMPRPLAPAEAPVSGIGMLKIDDDMRQTKPAPEAAPPEAPPQPEAPAVAVKADPVPAPKPAKKAFVQPRLNSGAFSGLNGGTGLSGGSMGGGGAAAPAAPAIPAVPSPEKK